MAFTLLKFALAMLAVMGLIMLAAVLTPKIAKLIDKNKTEPSPERVEDNISPDEYKVVGPYDKQEMQDFDPNYKIYNTDIYGFNKNDKTKNND